MYTVTYKATYYLLSGSSDTVYTNVIKMEAYGTTYTSDKVSQGNSDASIMGENYSIEISKVDADNTETKLSGAEFVIYNMNGVQLTIITTDNVGKASAKTDTSAGIIFTEHTLYYLQEITPPAGCVLDTTKYYFWFCNNSGNSCTTCDNLEASLPSGSECNQLAATGGIITVKNEKEKGYELSSTGGPGTGCYYFFGLLLIAGAWIILRSRKAWMGRN
ncbi:MAG: hypothetical protein LIO94_07095 [Clostridiales bacterium]|nr:hypothetical protein [Clostridiales bacterium]